MTSLTSTLPLCGVLPKVPNWFCEPKVDRTTPVFLQNPCGNEGAITHLAFGGENPLWTTQAFGLCTKNGGSVLGKAAPSSTVFSWNPDTIRPQNASSLTFPVGLAGQAPQNLIWAGATTLTSSLCWTTTETSSGLIGSLVCGGLNQDLDQVTSLQTISAGGPFGDVPRLIEFPEGSKKLVSAVKSPDVLAGAARLVSADFSGGTPPLLTKDIPLITADSAGKQTVYDTVLQMTSFRSPEVTGPLVALLVFQSSSPLYPALLIADPNASPEKAVVKKIDLGLLRVFPENGFKMVSSKNGASLQNIAVLGSADEKGNGQIAWIDLNSKQVGSEMLGKATLPEEFLGGVKVAGSRVGPISTRGNFVFVSSVSTGNVFVFNLETKNWNHSPIFQLPASALGQSKASITTLDYNPAQNALFVADSKGNLYRLSLKGCEGF